MKERDLAIHSWEKSVTSRTKSRSKGPATWYMKEMQEGQGFWHRGSKGKSRT